jgi:hypothetical protein
VRFYYFSIFSWMLYPAIVAIGIVLFWALWTHVFKLKVANPVYWLLVAAILIAPWAEELWIAYNFDRLCRKDAGVFVNKTVEVDGFYDSTLRSAYELTKAGRYKFVEHPTEDRKGTERVELATAAERERALAWYAERNPGRERPKDRSVFYPVNEKEVIAVLPNGIDAWKVTRFDKPTARYQYKTINSHTPVAHQITRFEDIVGDAQTGEVLGRHVNYYRGAYWFFISLSRPTIPCKETQAGTRQHGTLIYRAVLTPSK